MSKQLNSTVKTLAKNLGKLKFPAPTKRRRNRRRTRKGRARGPDGILAGYGSPLTSMFSSRSTQDGLVVRGYDLLTSFELGQNISFYMTANPASWNGTRIAAIAAGFQNYRPKRFVIHYRPQVGSTSTLSMFIGTLWQTNYITSRTALEPSLLTSPGGVYLPAWNDVTTHVRLGTNLPQRMFPTRDPHFTTVPFAIIARASEGGPSGVSAPMPGRIFIEYEYEFRNAIGSGTGFSPSQVRQYTVSTNNGHYEAYTATNEQPPQSGVLVDVEGTSDATYSNDFPLGGQVTFTFSRFDQDLGQVYDVTINGETPITGVTLIIFVYSDNGNP